MARVVACVSPLTCAQDLMNHAVLRAGPLNPWLDLAVLLTSGVLFIDCRCGCIVGRGG